MKYLLPLLFICSIIINKTIAQNSTKLDSIQQITQKTYQYRKGSSKMTILKKSYYDTNQIMIEQNRYNYVSVDTGLSISTHYHFEYDPRYQNGLHFTQRFALPSRPKRKPSKQTTKFKSFDDHYKKTWIKIFKKNNPSLLKQTQNKYDSNGNLVSIVTTNFKNKPASKYTEKIQRNRAGKMTKWESFDNDGDTKTQQARNFDFTYKNDTLLVKSKGYLYFNWNQTTYKYNGKKELKKLSLFVGNRSLNGKVKILDKTITIYKDNRPFKKIEKKLNKKTKTIQYTYEQGKEIQSITTPNKNYQEVKHSIYLDSLSLLSRYTETKEGKAFLEIDIVYDTTSGKHRIMKHTEVEYRKNGKNWKTIKEYNLLGNLTKKSFYIADKMRRKDVYHYTYFPPTPPKEDK